MCQSTPRRGGGGGSVTLSQGRGGIPSQVWVGGVPHPRSGRVGGYPSQVPLRHGMGLPPPGPGMGYPPGWGMPLRPGTGYPPRPGTGYPPGPGMGYPPGPGTGYPPGPEMGYPPPTDQHSEHLLHGGRYASCVHAGGLSCLRNLLIHLCCKAHVNTRNTNLRFSSLKVD